jgi:adenosylhomocysteine nucleosidase
MPPSPAARPTILIPLQHEWSGLRRALPDLAVRATIEVCGIGPSAIERRLRARGPTSTAGDRPSLLVLVGTSGGLREGLEIGSAGFIHRVVDGDGPDTTTSIGTPWLPASRASHSFPRFTVAGVGAPAATVEAKRALHERTGADVVDMESHAFAREASAREQPFAVIRGVSDGPEDVLPDGLERLIHPDGRTNWGQALGLIVRRPAMAGTLRSLGRQSDAAMAAVAPLLSALLDEWERGG